MERSTFNICIQNVFFVLDFAGDGALLVI